MSFLSSLPGKTSLMDVAKKFVESYRLLDAYHTHAMHSPSPLTPAERELIAAHVSRLNGCEYCVGIHTASAELLGIDRALLDGLPASAEGPLVNAKLRAALSFARKLTEGPRRMAQADADALYAAGWDERALYDIVSVTALYNLYNRLVEGLGVEAGPEYYRAAAERLTKAVREPRA